MYIKEEREAILWEFHRSGMSVGEACRRLPLFPTRTNLYRWLRMEEAGELAAAEPRCPTGPSACTAREPRASSARSSATFFEARGWAGEGFEEFRRRLDEYIEWYRSSKLKKSLGWRTIRRHREELGYTT